MNPDNEHKQNHSAVCGHAHKHHTHTHEIRHTHKGVHVHEENAGSCEHADGHSCHHHGEVNEKTVNGLVWAFAVNMLLSIAELAGGIIGGSIALVADAFHNTFDAFSILIAVIAWRIGRKIPDEEYTFGYRRAETIGGFINLILLFVSGCYLLYEGISRLVTPEKINGSLIIWISVLALIIDIFTAKLSHHGSHGNSNMKMLFLHNVADALGSVAVIVSGLCVIYLDWYFVDGVMAVLISAYMIFQAAVSFRPVTRILMNAMPEGLSVSVIKNELMNVEGVTDIHHIHIWNIDEKKIAFACHAVTADGTAGEKIKHLLDERFGIEHSTVQVETARCSCDVCR